MKIGRSADKSFAYILGVYLGDGCVVRGSRAYTQSTIDKDFASAVETALRDLTNGATITVTHRIVPKRGANCSPDWSIYCGDAALTKRLVDDTDRKNCIPPYVFAWDDELKKQFIIGLMDSEGFVAANNRGQHRLWAVTNRSYYMGFKSCDVWVPDLIKLMQSVGLRIGKVSQEAPRKAHYKTPTRFAIKMQSWIDCGMQFNIARKQLRVDEWASVGPYERRAKFPRGAIKKTCAIDGCDAPMLAKSMCCHHYDKARRAKANLRDYTPRPLTAA